MSKYYPLNKVFHINSENHEVEYQNRLNQLSAYLTEIEIKPIRNGDFYNESFPLFLVNTHKLAALNEAIIENSRTITLLKNRLPRASQQSFYTNLIINEIQSTNEVENVRSTKKEISEVLEDIKNSDLKQDNITKKRLFGLVKLYYFIEQESEITKVEDIRSIYDELVSSEISKKDRLDGELFRKGSVSVHSGGKEIHRGVMSESKIISMLGQMISFIRNDDMPYLYKLMLSHYIFEYIHPFYDGNGRMGRYIVCKLLSKKLDIYSAVTFSTIINKHKSKYYKAFTETSHPLNKAEATFFVQAMLEMIVEGQEQVISILEKDIDKINKISNSLDALVEKEFDRSVLYIMAQSAIFQNKSNRISVNELANEHDCDRRRILNTLDRFKDQLEVVKKRPAIYTLTDEYLDELLS